MAVVVSPTNNFLTFSPNTYEWPSLIEQYSEPRSLDAIPVRVVICEHTHCQCNEAVLALQTYVESHNSYSENARDDTHNVDIDADVTNTGILVYETGSGSNTSDHPSLYVEVLNDVPNEPLVPDSSERLASPECSNAIPQCLEDASVLQSASDPEMSDYTPESETVGIRHGKKKKRLKKARRKSFKKWKPYRIDELGFNISLTTYSEDEAANIEGDNTDDVDTVNVEPVGNMTGDNDVCEDDMTQTEPVGNTSVNSDSCKSKLTQVELVEDISNSTDQDDINFFLDLGIDVVNDDNQDDIQNWDGVFISAPSEYSSCRVIDNKKSSRSNNKRTKGATDRQTDTSRRAAPKANRQCQTEPVQIFPVPSFEFSKIKKSDKYKLFELECASNKRIYIRRDRHRKKEKVHKAVKSKNCRSILNNIGRKRMYMHHRLIKMHSLDLDFRTSVKSCRIPAMPKTTVAADVAKVVFRADRKTPATDHLVPPVQNLNHALHETNVAGIEGDLANFLITLQHRDLTPEDYDMLLRLDDSVKPKTLSGNVLQKLRTEKIGPNGPEQGASDWEPLCTICMEPYITGQERKFLPCDHDFHSECIDKWLKNSSMNCPLDGLPVEAS
ncbi:unnamed protein product [Candidula unifasciata]|uniref:RING-type domain-containing protein n=1 Tax=Candidula unifasciata TaxID=100452 RepID=A0A8S4ABZ3_9EUPU|nr:unnamed protein product [Candidula unifasciata]